MCLQVCWIGLSTDSPPTVNQSVGPRVHQSTYQHVHQSTVPLVHQSTIPLFHQSTDPLVHQSAVLLVHQSTVGFVHQSTVLLVHQSIVQQLNKMNALSVHQSTSPIALFWYRCPLSMTSTPPIWRSWRWRCEDVFPVFPAVTAAWREDGWPCRMSLCWPGEGETPIRRTFSGRVFRPTHWAGRQLCRGDFVTLNKDGFPAPGANGFLWTSLATVDLLPNHRLPV